MSRSWLARGLALAAVVLGAVAPTAGASQSEIQDAIALVQGMQERPTGANVVVRSGEVDETGLSYEVVYNWPSELRRGWYPLEVTLTNGNDEELGVRIEAETRWANEDLVTKRLTLAPNQTSTIELLLRARDNGANQYTLTIAADGEDVRVRDCGPTNASGADSRDVLYVASEQAAAGSKDDWSQDWQRAVESGSWGPGYGNQRVTPRLFSQLSSNWQAYTSLDSVILDLSEGEPAEEDLAALLAWCRAGGTLHALGLPVGTLRDWPALAPYLEPRFETSIANAETFEQLGLEAYTCGFGRLVVQTGSTPPEGLMGDREGSMPLAFVADRSTRVAGWSRASDGQVSRQASAQGLLGTFAALPLRALMVLLLVFALVMGPVNFLYVRRSKKPLLLLATVPGIALVTSLGLLAYGILAEGLDVKVMTKSWSLIDQRTQLATSAEVRNLFAGSSPGEGLRPETGTAVVPEDRFWFGSWRDESLFTCDYTDGRLLGGTYVPVRRPVGQLVLSDRASRLRLEARRLGDQIEVTNALGATIEEIVLRTPDGEYHYLQDTVAEGAAESLTWGGASARGMEVTKELPWFWTGASGRNLPRGTYLARLSAHPLRDDLGIEVTEVEGEHIVLGLLDGDEGAWK